MCCAWTYEIRCHIGHRAWCVYVGGECTGASRGVAMTGDGLEEHDTTGEPDTGTDATASAGPDMGSDATARAAPDHSATAPPLRPSPPLAKRLNRNALSVAAALAGVTVLTVIVVTRPRPLASAATSFPSAGQTAPPVPARPAFPTSRPSRPPLLTTRATAIRHARLSRVEEAPCRSASWWRNHPIGTNVECGSEQRTADPAGARRPSRTFVQCPAVSGVGLKSGIAPPSRISGCVDEQRAARRTCARRQHSPPRWGERRGAARPG